MELIKEDESILRELTYKYDSSEESYHHRREMVAAGYTIMNRWSGSGTHYVLYRKRIKRAAGPPLLDL